MKQLLIIGALAEKYGERHELQVKTVRAALKLMEANYPGFLQAADGYALVLMDTQNPDNARQVTPETGGDLWGDEVLMIIPRVSGELPAAAVAAIATAASSAAAAAGASAGLAATIGTMASTLASAVVSMAISTIANVAIGAITGDRTPTATSREKANNKPSYIFNGAVNTFEPGHPWPVLLGGALQVGGQIVSVDINPNYVRRHKKKTA